MVIKQIIMVITCVFFVLGAIDYFLNSRFGLGAEFKRAFNMAGPIILASVGNVCIAPFIGVACLPVVGPVLRFIGADPAVFPALLFAPDSGYRTAMAVADNAAVGAWAGCVVCAMIGGLITFSIPSALGIIKKRDHRYFSIGCMSGLISTPFACIAGGLVAALDIRLLLLNMTVPIVITLIIIFLLWKVPDFAIRAFVIFGRLIMLMILTGLTLAVIEKLTGLTLVKGLNPLSEGFSVIGTVLVTIAGILTMTRVIRALFGKPLHRLAERMGIDDYSLIAILLSVCTVVAGYIDFHKMNNKGKVVFAAVVASAANVLGAHLGFIGVYAPEMLPPMIAAKIFAGIVAVPLSLLFCRRILTREEAKAVLSQEDYGAE
ncbi:MAG: ethanolamine utilization protein EutH [Oscillospiraceae bacterium]|nr:ethanolamine utilization protein EutH [Oscillospiraceae bacterium]